MYSVRDALDTEVFLLAELSEMVMLESTYSHMNFDKEKVANYLYGAIMKQPGWFMRIIVDDSNTPVGGMVCVCETSMWGSDKSAYDLTIMISEEHRGRCLRQLIQIIDEYKVWATEQGAKIIKLGVSSGINIDKASAFFEVLGFERIGAMHGLRVGT